MPPNRFESEVESFLEGSHGDRTHIKRADHPRLHHYAGRYSHDAFARQNCAENRCIWLAMVSSVSPETEHTPAKAMTVSRDSPAAPVGGRGARLWCPWAVAGPGRASKRRTKPHISDQAPPVCRAPEGPEGTGGLRGAAPNEVRP